MHIANDGDSDKWTSVAGNKKSNNFLRRQPDTLQEFMFMQSGSTPAPGPDVLVSSPLAVETVTVPSATVSTSLPLS